MPKPATTLTHDWLWTAIDTLAARRGLTPSGLARLAGLDPTAFNRSKRFTPEGRPRWPSTESLSKLLEATGTTLDAFATIHLETSAAVPIEAARLPLRRRGTAAGRRRPDAADAAPLADDARAMDGEAQALATPDQPRPHAATA